MLVLLPSISCIPTDSCVSPGRDNILHHSAGWGGGSSEHLYFIVLLVLQKRRFICKEFITITGFNMLLQNLLGE